MIRLTYAPDLLEESVLLAEQSAPRGEAAAFRRDRDRIYEIVDREEREAHFRTLHARWFTRLGLDRFIEQIVAERTEVAERVPNGRVLRALTRREQGADLADGVLPTGPNGPPTLILRLCPATVLDSKALGMLLHHELTHVADMLDSGFGYERTLPASEAGPSGDNILRDRYRVLWDATIDGRLSRTGLAGGSVRDARWLEFAAAFPMLGEGRASAFDRWFNETRPRHQDLVAFATAPSELPNAGNSGRCPLCRFPAASLDVHIGRLSHALEAAIRLAHPDWRIEHGLCVQCLDLYQARHEEVVDVGASMIVQNGGSHGTRDNP